MSWNDTEPFFLWRMTQLKRQKQSTLEEELGISTKKHLEWVMLRIDERIDKGEHETVITFKKLTTFNNRTYDARQLAENEKSVQWVVNALRRKGYRVTNPKYTYSGWDIGVNWKRPWFFRRILVYLTRKKYERLYTREGRRVI